jgi:hypothetical protein
MIPKARVPAIEAQIQSGDIIGIISRDGDAYGTSHVGLAAPQERGPALHARVFAERASAASRWIPA